MGGGGDTVATGIQWVEVKDAAKHPAMPRSDPRNRIIRPKCQHLRNCPMKIAKEQYEGWEEIQEGGAEKAGGPAGQPCRRVRRCRNP